MRCKNLHTAKTKKDDEFYTRMCDIETELHHYESILRGKVILCNCDTPESNFSKYFDVNFDRLGLKDLVTTDEDFRSDASVALLKRSDIVITNPPFSLWREYLGQLHNFNKKFLIVGSLIAVHYSEAFKLLKTGQIHLGNTHIHTFERPGGGIKPQVARWYTNLTPCIRPELKLTKMYCESEYPTYDEFPAINVNKVKEIPSDYFGEMGVPISFIDSYCPTQFELLRVTGPHIRGKKLFIRIIIKRRMP